MTQTRAYISSSYPDLVDYRDAARRLLSQHHIDGRGMEDSDYVANPSLYEKCITDAASADLVLLIVGFRYGTRLPQYGDQSLVELEYEAATNAGRDLRAFLLTDQRLPEADDRRGPDGGAAIERFRRRLIDDGRHVAYVTDLDEFERKCDKLLVEYRRKLLDQRENHPAARAGNREQLFLETYLRDVIERNKVLETFYVPLAGTTKSVQAPRPWHDQMFGEPLMAEEEARLEIRVDHVVEALRMHEQFYLAAEPGGGKTLSLIAMETAAAHEYLTDRRRFPLRLDVARWTAEEDFGTFLDRELNERTKVATLPPSQLLLLLDGVIDSAAAGSDPLERIETWLRQHERCKAVLAVRAPRAFSRKLPVVRIAPLDDARVRKFVHLRLSNDAAKAAALLQRVGVGETDRRAGAGFATLTSNPFNLSLICDLELQERLPRNAFALLNAVVAFKHAKERKKRPHVPWESFVEAVGAVAVAMIRNRARLAADSAWLRKVMPPGEPVSDVLALAKDCQVMIEHGAGERYEFRHRLYLEYFAAERLRRHREMLDDVLEEPDYSDGQRVARKFDEVIEALVQIEADVGIIETVAAYDPLLGVRCLRLLTVEDDLRSRAVSAVVNALGSLITEADAREEAIAKLAGLGAPAVTVLRRLINDSRHFVRRAAVRALSQIPDTQAIEAVVLALCDANAWVRDDAQSAIRRFDARFRELLLQCIRTRMHARLDDPTEPVLDALVTLIEGLPERQYEFGAAIAEAAGIELETVEDPAEQAVVEPAAATAAAEAHAAPVPQEASPVIQDAVIEQDDEVMAEAASWGRRWQEEWEADRGNPALTAAGRAWLRSTSIRDTAWPFVWTALWAERSGPDPDLEWLARDWLARTPARVRSWSYVWQRVFRESPDEQLTRSGHAWLGDPQIRPEQFGWSYVWRALWDADSRRDELVRSGFWWLETVDAKLVDSWSIVWSRVWDSDIARQQLERIGRAWIGEAAPDSASWGFVWPRLWAAAPGDADLLALGKAWLEAAPSEHGAWSYIWSGVAAMRDVPASVEEKARRFVREQPPASLAWFHMWEPLWNRNRRDPELATLGRAWLATTSPAHGAWAALWESLWELMKEDPELTVLGRKALREMPASAALRTVCIHLLAHAHGDSELLDLARNVFLNALDDNHHTGFPGLWRVQWDAGGDQQWLEPLGRRWVLGAGMQSGSFQQVWQPLWRMSPGDTELGEALVTWIRKRKMSRGTAQSIASILLEALKSQPGDVELLTVARETLLAAPRADRGGSGWVVLWRLQWDFGGDREWLWTLGLQWLCREGMQSAGFVAIWQRLWGDRDATAPSATPELKRIAADWLRVGNYTTAAQASYQHIASILEEALTVFPADPDLLGVARENLMTPPRSGRNRSRWPALWRIQWDLGGEREWLEPLGRRWLREEGMENGFFVSLWQRLWADRNVDMNAQSRTAELTGIAIDWLTKSIGGFQWEIVAEAVAKAEPRNEELLAIARTVAAGDASAVDWATAWRILADAGILDNDLLARGMQLLEGDDPKLERWALLWCGLTQAPRESVARAWELMGPAAFDHPLWPEVWEKLWERDALQRPRLAQAGADWGNVHATIAWRITRWSEIEALLRADEARSAAVSRIRARLKFLKPGCGQILVACHA
jgi:hypothetical protein